MAFTCRKVDGGLRSRQVSEARHDSSRYYQHRRDPVNHFLCHTFRALCEAKSTSSDDERGNGDSAHLGRAGNSLRRPQVGLGVNYGNRLIWKN